MTEVARHRSFRRADIEPFWREADVDISYPVCQPLCDSGLLLPHSIQPGLH